MGYFDSIYSSSLPHRARAVYMYLKDRTNKDGVCWPSIKTMAIIIQKFMWNIYRMEVISLLRSIKPQLWAEAVGPLEQ